MPISTSRGFELYYETHRASPAGGEGGDGVPLLLLTGLGATCQGWHVLQVPALSRDRTNVLLDNRGAGRSEDPGEPFSTADLADDAVAVLDDLDIERIDVMGVLLGGQVAQELAIRYPERVNALVLVGTFARADARRRLLLELWDELTAQHITRETMVKSRLLWMLHDLTFEQDDITQAMMKFYLEDDEPMDAKTYARQIAACLEHDTMDRLEQIAAPTLVVCGEQDIVAPPALARQLANRIPNSRLVPIPSAGHLVMVEMWRRFNRLVARFLLEYD